MSRNHSSIWLKNPNQATLNIPSFWVLRRPLQIERFLSGSLSSFETNPSPLQRYFVLYVRWVLLKHGVPIAVLRREIESSMPTAVNVGKRTYGFLMEHGYVYFSIVDGSLRNSGGQQLVPVIRHLINSLEQVSCNPNLMVPGGLRFCYHNIQGLHHHQKLVKLKLPHLFKTPLLGKSSKQEKKKVKDRVIEVRNNGSPGITGGLGDREIQG
ncbi:hypothetical protein NE237_011421 [Protea cynaroides]|uniref:Uncharacterized protein n=1 Tax=Protea cynaroides TaxID=273540 RepID=A0A9Q0GXX0_9MAGN|nr:hypothetical protein NE237_011421 [Protea cynaroides]